MVEIYCFQNGTMLKPFRWYTILSCMAVWIWITWYIFFNLFQVACFPFDDHNCPPLQLITSFCQSAYSWLKEDIQNVVVVHCKAGMGRTGLMICSLLLFLKVVPIGISLRISQLSETRLFPWFSRFLFFQSYSYFIFVLCAVLPNCWGGHWLLQPEKMCGWEGSRSSKSDC